MFLLDYFNCNSWGFSYFFSGRLEFFVDFTFKTVYLEEQDEQQYFITLPDHQCDCDGAFCGSSIAPVSTASSCVPVILGNSTLYGLLCHAGLCSDDTGAPCQ